MTEQLPIWDLKSYCPGSPVLPDDRHTCPPPEPLIHRVGGTVFLGLARVRSLLSASEPALWRGRLGFYRWFQKPLGGLQHPETFPLHHPVRQFVRLCHVFQNVVKIRVFDALDFHPAQTPQFRQQFFGQKSVRQEDGVVMHPPAFVEFHLDAIGRIDDVKLAFMLDAFAKLVKHLAQPVSAVLKCRFLVRITFRVQSEGEK